MSLKCDICYTPYTLHEGVYICEEGHIYEHNEEVCDTYVGFTGRAKKQDKNTQTQEESMYHNILKIFTQLYIEMKEVLEIKDDLIFKIFLSYIRYENNAYNEYFTYHFLFAILYYQKRIEYESEGKALLYTEFVIMFDVPLYNYKLHVIMKKREQAKQKVIQSTKFHHLEIQMFYCLHYLQFLGEYGYKEKKLNVFYKEKDFDHECKRIMRMAVRRDQEMLDLYFNEVCKVLFLEISDDLQKSFNKFCNFYFTDERIFIPELIIYSFLFLYVRNKKIDLHFELIESEHCYVEDYNDKFEREMNDYREIFADEKKYIKELCNKKVIVKNKVPFPEYKSIKKRLRKIFCFLIKLPPGKFKTIISYLRLFLDCCRGKHLYDKFLLFEKLYGIRQSLIRTVKTEIMQYEKREAKDRERFAKFAQ